MNKAKEDLTILELKAIILDHIDLISNSQQTIQVARGEIAARNKNNSDPVSSVTDPPANEEFVNSPE